MTQLTNHLIVISFDCLSALDMPMLSELPHFQELLRDGSYCTNVESIYPSITYPCHASIVTGNYPNRHGVINNTFIQPGVPSPDWYWHRRHVKGTTLYEEAKKAGMTTAALLWPVTARAKIDFHMPEIFANRPWHHQVAVSLLNGSPMYQLNMNRRFGQIRNGLNYPQLDDFVLESAVHTIVTKKPNLMLVHFTDLDSHRHYHGFASPEAHDAILRHNTRLGRILQALRDAGIYENSTVVALGDHSALDHSHAVNLNVLLRKYGLIQVDERGKVTGWSAYCKSCDGSAYIYVRDGNTSAAEVVKELLHNLVQDEDNGIESILTGAEAAAQGADGNALFMLEARRGYYFTEYLDGNFVDIIRDEDVRAKRYTHASHGYSPKKDAYATIFMARGKGIAHNLVIPAMRLVDEGPTFARLLGLNLGDTDGRIVNELLTV